jgi:hypothetical protein
MCELLTISERGAEKENEVLQSIEILVKYFKNK